MKIYSHLRWSLLIITLFWVTVITSSPSFSAREQRPETSKIAPGVLEKTADGKEAEFLVVLNEQADLSGAGTLPTKEEKGRYVRDALWNKAQATQGALLNWLSERKIKHRSYYIVNFIWVRGTSDIALALAARPDVLRLEDNPQIRNLPNPLPVDETPALFPDAITAIEWGITNTRAPEVWALGFIGQGMVVGGADTGYQWDHPALQGKYRGWNGATANHNYNWHDSIHSGGGSCGASSVQPCDDNGHGTHTMGSAVGDDGGSNQIGMAPGAKWIGCRNMDQGVGTPTTYLECFQFFLAPYPVGSTPAQGDSTKAPDVTINSWSCPPAQGCSAGTLQAAVEAQRAAGIMTVVAAGGSGPACSTIDAPPVIYDAAYSIGAHSITNAIASFSSRGPVTVDGSMRIKPDLTAPGVNVRSSLPGNTYGSLSGTSMAAPHVAGAVALLWSSQPLLRHDVSRTETILNQTAVQVFPPSPFCGSDTSTSSPNNVWGHGRLDVKAAVSKLALLAAVSRKTHMGAGAFDINLPFSGEPGVECRSTGGAYTLVFTFNNNVVGGNASVTSGTGGVSGSSSFSGNQMTVTLAQISNAQTVIVTLSNVTDTLSQVLADTAVSAGFLIGDTNGDRTVNSGDALQTRNRSGQAASASNFRSDVNADGFVNSGDTLAVRSRSGTSLP